MALRSLLPNLLVLGGCCGTDHRHISAIADAYLATQKIVIDTNVYSLSGDGTGMHPGAYLKSDNIMVSPEGFASHYLLIDRSIQRHN